MPEQAATSSEQIESNEAETNNSETQASASATNPTSHRVEHRRHMLEEAPIVSAIKWLQNTTDKTGEVITSTGTQIEELLDDNLRFEHTEPEETTLLKTPVYATAHLLDGTALNYARRRKEVIAPLIHSATSAVRLSIGNIYRPIRAFGNPIERIIKPTARIATGVLTSLKNDLLIPIRGSDDLVTRSIRNTTLQTNTKIGKIPILGQAFAGITNISTRVAAKITNTIRGVTDFVTKPVDMLHGAMAPA